MRASPSNRNAQYVFPIDLLKNSLSKFRIKIFYLSINKKKLRNLMDDVVKSRANERKYERAVSKLGDIDLDRFSILN